MSAHVIRRRSQTDSRHSTARDPSHSLWTTLRARCGPSRRSQQPSDCFRSSAFSEFFSTFQVSRKPARARAIADPFTKQRRNATPARLSSSTLPSCKTPSAGVSLSHRLTCSPTIGLTSPVSVGNSSRGRADRSLTQPRYSRLHAHCSAPTSAPLPTFGSSRSSRDGRTFVC